MRRAAPLFALALGLALLVAGCGDSESTHTFSDIRERDKPRVVVPPDTTAAQRYGYRDPRGGGHGGDPHAGVPGMGGMGSTAPGGKPFAWKTPEGWEEVKGSASRDGSWKVKGEPQTDISLSKLKGTGGGIVLNVNRWRKQMGAPELDEAAVKALPRKQLLGREAVYVDVPGRYGGGMGSGGSIESARMLGLVLQLPTAAIFLKFTGPADVVEANQGAFEQLAASVKLAAHGGSTATAPPPRPSSGRPEFTWQLPEGWELRQGRGGRVVTVGPQGADQTECYLYLLGGDGGGIDLNINRWCGQLQQKSMTPDEISDLERIDALGVKAPVIKLAGTYRGMGGAPIENALFYGAVMLKETYLLTATMYGPNDQMAAEWDNFIAFCRSVREK